MPEPRFNGRILCILAASLRNDAGPMPTGKRLAPQLSGGLPGGIPALN